MTLDLSGRVAIVTGAGAGLGRAHSLALASRGAAVVVNDLSPDNASAVVQEIIARGGKAMAVGANVADFSEVTRMVAEVEQQLGPVDILINNAGILRDRTFAKMDLQDFQDVIQVHLMGSVHCTKAVWEGMRERSYGRIVFTTSSSGLYGNFGQSNYSAAKMALVGLMKTLTLEGQKYNIRVNCLAPSAATAMTSSLYSEEVLRGLDPELVSPAILALSAQDAPSGKIILAGSGSFEAAHVTMTRGVFIGNDPHAGEQLLEKLDLVCSREGEMVPISGNEQYEHESAHGTGSPSSNGKAA